MFAFFFCFSHYKKFLIFFINFYFDETLIIMTDDFYSSISCFFLNYKYLICLLMVHNLKFNNISYVDTFFEISDPHPPRGQLLYRVWKSNSQSEMTQEFFHRVSWFHVVNILRINFFEKK